MEHSLNSTVVDAADHVTATASPLSGPPPRAPQESIITYVGYQDDWHELHIDSSGFLGKGAFGKVYVAKLLGPSAPPGNVAVKAINKPDDKPQSDREAAPLILLDREVARWKNLNHRRILPFYGRSEPFPFNMIGLVSPLASNGNMLEFILKHPDEDRLRLVQQVAEGMHYLHQDAKIVHGDLKCSNILIDADLNALIADFGLSTALESGEDPTKTSIRRMHSVAFAAPEILTDEAYAQSEPSTTNPKRSKTTWSDSFAFGRLVYQAYAGEKAWGAEDTMQIYERVKKYETPPKPVHSSIARELSAVLWDLCERCWKEDPFGRPQSEEILQILTSELGKGQT